MQIQFSFLTRRAKGAPPALRDNEITGDVVIIGRSSKCEIALQDLRIGLEEASIQIEDGRAMLRSIGDRKLGIGGAEAAAVALTPATTIQLGPYEIVVVEPPEGFDLAITIEMKIPVGDDDEKVRKAARLDLGGPLLNKRRLSSVGFAVVAVLFLVLPIVQFLTTKPLPAGKEYRVWPAAFDVAWNSGQISNPHKQFASQCAVCHEAPFVMVRNSSCTQCHEKVGNHIDSASMKVPEIDDSRCGTCHKEHQGPRGAIAFSGDENLCADCHLNLKATVPNTTLVNAGEFGGAHPEFRITVVADPKGGKLARIAQSNTAALKDNSGLKFPHDKHLNVRGVIAPEGRRTMSCASCHLPEPGGAGIAPINMEAHCGDCHALRFEPRAPQRALPHAALPWAVQQIRDFYGAVALNGGFEDPSAPSVVRRRPGTPISEDQRAEALAWATVAADRAVDYLASYAVCGTCHTVEAAPETPERYRIASVRLLDQFMPKAKFTHAKHTDTACTECHKATTSTSSADVLMPDLASCQTCHGGQTAANRVPSTCVDCHDFHRHDVGPMRPKASKAADLGDRPFLVAVRRAASVSAPQ